MKVLLIGGTGTISTEVTRLALQMGLEVTLLNRGNSPLPEGAKSIVADINNEAAVASALGERQFDAVADFIAYHPDQARRDVRLFAGRTKQFFFISSASAYQKPPRSPFIDESTPLCNEIWQYSKEKIQCEEVLMAAWRKQGFPVTIVRPSHTYCERSVPVCLHGDGGSWTVLKRMLDGKPVIIPGDGTSLWTLTHSRDFAKAFVGLIGNWQAIGQAYGITSDEVLTWNAIHEIIADALGVPLKAYHVASEFLADVGTPGLRPSILGDKANCVVFDNSKIKKAVPGFHASIRFDEGARQAVAYMLSHPECQQFDAKFDAWCDRVIDAQERVKKEFLQ